MRFFAAALPVFFAFAMCFKKGSLLKNNPV
jgi:hypothetical protein